MTRVPDLLARSMKEESWSRGRFASFAKCKGNVAVAGKIRCDKIRWPNKSATSEKNWNVKICRKGSLKEITVGFLRLVGKRNAQYYDRNEEMVPATKNKEIVLIS